MNRGTVILLALAILIAHTFAIHQTPDGGDIAETYDLAHVAYRLGRNLAYEGAAVWNPGGAAVESYPSPAWVMLSALAARLYLSPILVTQAVGLCSALATIFVLAQFSPKRTSGLIAPVLLATSGSAAAAAMCGTETALAMGLVTTAFLAFERGYGRTLALALSLLIVTRPEGVCILLFLWACEGRWRPESENGVRPPRWNSYRLPFVLAAAGLCARRWLCGNWLSPFTAPLFELDLERWRLGAQYFSSFVVASGSGLLVLAVVLSQCAGRLSALGGRALALAALWWALVVLTGGDGLPFWNALVPVLPLFFLAVQECLRQWMDERESLTWVVWPLLLVSAIASLLVSKVPGDFGPLPLEEPLTAWQTPRGELARAYPRPLGRLGLIEEIRSVEHLRALGVFLRDRVAPDAVIMTSRPGAIGYLSRKQVLDLSGRAWPLPGQERTASWRGVTHVDVVKSLTPEVDYIVPVIGTLSESEEPADFLVSWLERYDTVGPTEERVREMLAALQDFMLISVPVPARSRKPREPSERPFRLLQRMEPGMIPVLELELLELEGAGARLRVRVRHEGHQQVVDLCARAVTAGGEELYLSPTGSWKAAGPLDARTSLLIFPTGARSIELLAAPVPAELRGAELEVWLHNPGMPPEAPLAPVGASVSRKL
jgi:hypothetical protein